MPPARSIRVGAFDAILNFTRSLCLVNLERGAWQSPAPRCVARMIADGRAPATEMNSIRSIRQNLLGKFILGFEGTSLPAELADLLREGLAGVAIFHRNFTSLENLRALTDEIRRAASRPLLIGMDQEGGTRFALREPFTIWPAPSELGRVNDSGLVERMAQAIALELRAAGCNLDFAPMLDLHMNAASPVTSERSFGADPARVAQLGTAFIRGLASGGVFACAKHFPGHGDTQVDPHLDLPKFVGDMKRLQTVELVPFGAAIDAGVPLFMTAHILLPKIDRQHPASLSRLMLTEVLRKKLGFNGIILADDLGMGAIAKRWRPGEAAIKSFQAGTDVVMLCHDWPAVHPAIEAVEKAQERGDFDPTEWQASHGRLERLRAAADGLVREQPGVTVVGSPQHRALAAEIRMRVGRPDERR